MQSSFLDCYGNRLVTASFASSLVVTVSLINGISNVRRDSQIISQCELDYGLFFEVHWLQYPYQFIQNIVCMDVDDLDMRDRVNHGACMSEIRKKINLFDSVDIQALLSVS